MQHELQRYKKIKNRNPPELEYIENSEGKTPPVVFTQEHKNLLKEAETWMKHKARFYVQGALIVAMVYVAALNILDAAAGDSGVPILTVPNAITAFSSTASLLTFRSFRTARYAEGDVVISLPRRLVVGLGALLLSTTSMMVSLLAAAKVVVDGDESGGGGGWSVDLAATVFSPAVLEWLEALPVL